jgi:hypothetical protein
MQKMLTFLVGVLDDAKGCVKYTNTKEKKTWLTPFFNNLKKQLYIMRYLISGILK